MKLIKKKHNDEQLLIVAHRHGWSLSLVVVVIGRHCCWSLLLVVVVGHCHCWSLSLLVIVVVGHCCCCSLLLLVIVDSGHCCFPHRGCGVLGIGVGHIVVVSLSLPRHHAPRMYPTSRGGSWRQREVWWWWWLFLVVTVLACQLVFVDTVKVNNK